MSNDRRNYPAEYQPAREPAVDGLRYVACADCGQVVDMHALGQVDRHNDEPHEPLTTMA